MRITLDRQAFRAMMGSVGAEERRADPQARTGRASGGKSPSPPRRPAVKPKTPSF